MLSFAREQWGIEVTASRRVDRADLSGLRSVGETLPRVTRTIVLFLGPRAQRIDDVEVLPLGEFLAELPR